MCIGFLDSTYKWCHVICIFLWFISLRMIISRSIHVVANGNILLGFPDGSADKESTRNAGDLGSISGLGRSPGEENGYPLQYSGEFHGLYSPWNHKESDTTEQLSLSLYLYYGWVIFHSVYLLKPTISFDYVKSQTALLAFSGEDGGRRKMLYDPQCEEYSCPIKNCSMSCTTFESPTEQLAQVKYLFVSFQF